MSQGSPLLMANCNLNNSMYFHTFLGGTLCKQPTTRRDGSVSSQVVLGSGKRLLPEGKRINLKLIESQALPTGVVFQRYQSVK